MGQKTAVAQDIITIDGPAGAGKSTVSKLVACRLRYTYLDTGAMYRVVAACVQRKGIDPQDDPSLKQLCAAVDIDFQGEGDRQRVFCQGEDVTEKIRESTIGWLASTVSTRRPVREAMVNLQRKIGSKGRVVAEGRDTGTVVFPGAKYKFFLVADSKERARRRFQELIAKGVATTIEEVDREMSERDHQDSTRELAPLRPAPDAQLIDSTNSSPEQVAGLILNIIREREATGNG